VRCVWSKPSRGQPPSWYSTQYTAQPDCASRPFLITGVTESHRPDEHWVSVCPAPELCQIHRQERDKYPGGKENKSIKRDSGQWRNWVGARLKVLVGGYVWVAPWSRKKCKCAYIPAQVGPCPSGSSCRRCWSQFLTMLRCNLTLCT